MISANPKETTNQSVLGSSCDFSHTKSWCLFFPLPLMLQLLHLDSFMPANQAFMLAYVRSQFLQILFGLLESYLILGFPSSSVNLQVKMVPFLLYLHRLEDLWHFQGFWSYNYFILCYCILFHFILILSPQFLMLFLSATLQLFNTKLLRLCITVVWYCLV